MSDFEIERYAKNLLGGKLYEPSQQTQCWASRILAMSLTTSATVLTLSVKRFKRVRVRDGLDQC